MRRRRHEGHQQHHMEGCVKILMESTKHIVMLDGVECRVWNAVTENETQCFVFVHRLAVRNSEDQKAFGELFECPEAEVQVLEQ